jgi:hypothetical protein
MPEESLGVTESGIEIHHRVPAVVHQWDRRENVREYVLRADRFQINGGVSKRPRVTPAAYVPTVGAATRTEAIVCFSGLREPATNLESFASNIREAGYTGVIEVLGVAFTAHHAEAARRTGCRLVQVDKRYAALSPGSAAALCFHDLLPGVAADDLLLIDGTRAIFIGDHFAAKTVGVTLFSKGARLIRSSEASRRRLRQFGVEDAACLDRQIVATELVAGRHRDVCAFYARVRAELAGKEHLLAEPGVLEGVFNKLAYADDPELPITVRPNGSVAYFPVVPSGMEIETEPVMRVGGAAPAILMAG